MSAKNNVNPDHYKTGGRDRPGDDLPSAPGQGAVKEPRKKADKQRNFIPGRAPVGRREENTKRG